MKKNDGQNIILVFLLVLLVSDAVILTREMKDGFSEVLVAASVCLVLFIGLLKALRLSRHRITRVIKAVFGIPYNIYENIRSYVLLKNRKETQNRVARVVFIVQLPEVWDKSAPVYRQMSQSSSFSTLLLIVPPFSIKEKTFVAYDGEADYFIKQANGGEYILTDIDHLNDINLRKIHPDYVFYQRPYNRYLPRQLQPREVASYASLCYIPYSFWAHADHRPGLNWSFFRYVRYAFMESEQPVNEMLKQHQKRYTSGIQHCMSVGYPVYDDVCQMEKKETVRTVLWTPRWSADKTLGGSHFMEYRREMFDLPRMTGTELIFRPHPLMFEELVRRKRMTQEEADNYGAMLAAGGIHTDDNDMIADTFKNTDVLISDLSSVMMDFFLRNRPIIYCPSEGIEECSTYKDLLEGMYLAYSFSDIISHICMLKEKGDVLYDVRRDIINRVYPDTINAGERITSIIQRDFENRMTK